MADWSSYDMSGWSDPSTFSNQSSGWTPTGNLSGFGGYGGGSSWNPANWFSSDPSGTFSNPTGGTGGGSGMNWAGLSSGLDKLSKSLSGSGTGSDELKGSQSVSGTVSGGTLQPAGGGSGASALGNVFDARNQLAQALLLAAMQGKGRGKSGGGLLG